jgi:putative two-component system response regulator
LEKALGIIRQGRGSHFDPEVVDAFFSVEEEILTVRDRYRDEQADMFASQLRFLGIGPD